MVREFRQINGFFSNLFAFLFDEKVTSGRSREDRIECREVYLSDELSEAGRPGMLLGNVTIGATRGHVREALAWNPVTRNSKCQYRFAYILDLEV
jgi:hypothetical protein